MRDLEHIAFDPVGTGYSSAVDQKSWWVFIEDGHIPFISHLTYLRLTWRHLNAGNLQPMH